MTRRISLTQATLRGRRGERRRKRRRVKKPLISSSQSDDACWFVEGTPRLGFLLCPMTNMAPLRCADVTGCLLTKRLPERRTCGQRAKIFSRPLGWYVIPWVFASSGSLLALQWYGRRTLLCSVAKLVLVIYWKECLHASSKRETSVSVQAFYPYSSFEAMK